MAPSELSCVRCGYNLRGLPREGKCPECGLDKAASFINTSLECLDASYASRLQRGIALILLSQAIWMLLLLIINDFLTFLVPVPIGLAGTGAILLTGHHYRPLTFIDHAIRFTAAATFAASIGFPVIEMLDRSSTLPLLPFALAWCMCTLFTFQKIGVLAARIGEANLADFATLVSYGFPLVFVVFPLMLIGCFAFLGPSGPFLILSGVLILAAGTAIAIFYFMGLSVLVGMWRRLSKSQLSMLFPNSLGQTN